MATITKDTIVGDILDIAPDIGESMDYDSLNSELASLRRALYFDLGVPFPGINIRPNAALPSLGYMLNLNEIPMSHGRLEKDMVIVREKEVEKLVETEKVVTAAVIEDGLRDMGKLVTEEYFFTEVVTFSSIKSYLKVEWKITESSFLASYDGVINAGIDFAGIDVVKDEEHKTVTVTLPAAEILAVDVDPDSLTVYSEKNGLGNHITVEDYSSALSVLEQNATAKALDKGILEKAEQNAERLIRPFIGSLVDLNEYSLRFERAA